MRIEAARTRTNTLSSAMAGTSTSSGLRRDRTAFPEGDWLEALRRRSVTTRAVTEQVLQPGYGFGNSFEFGLDLVTEAIRRLAGTQDGS